MTTKREKNGTRATTRSLETLAWNNSEENSIGRGVCNVCNVTRRVIYVVAICPSLVRAKEGFASDAVRSIKRARTTSSALALITARRRSYFTRRSSIIHAVNNAPLFRVTLYREKGGSLLPSLPISYILREMGRGRVRVFPGERPPPTPRTRRCVSGRDTLISRSIHRNGDTLRSDRSRGELTARLASYSTSSWEGDFFRMKDGMKDVSHPALPVNRSHIRSFNL